jgi:hypothetical protein
MVDMAIPGTMINTILDKIIQYFQEPKNREIIQTQCIDPLFKYILDRIFPYIILTSVVFCLILLMSIASIGLLVFQLHSSSALPALIESTIIHPTV